MTKAVIFDIDGTLLRSSQEDDELYRQAVRNVLGDVTFRGSLHDYDPVTDSAILVQVLSDNDVRPDKTIVERIRDEFFRLVHQHVVAHGPFPEIPGAREFLRRMHASDRYSIAIATGGWRQSALTKLRTAGFDIEGVPLASSDDAMDRAAIMQIAFDATAVRTGSVTYFGDGPWDREACRKLGWNFEPVGPAVGGLLSFAGLIEDMDI